MKQLRSHREVLKLSQSKLARVSGVSRFKICLFELGDGELTTDEQSRIRAALQAEAERLQDIAARIDLVESQSGGPHAEGR